jgi:hypothetical protein
MCPSMLKSKKKKKMSRKEKNKKNERKEWYRINITYQNIGRVIVNM